jgi:hypothetical protein
VSSVDIAPFAASQQVLAAQRSATQIILPSGETSTALVEPHARPSGSLNAPVTESNGFGKSLVGVADCHDVAMATGACPWAWLLAVGVPTTAAAATSANKTLRFCDMESLPEN